MEGIHEKIVKKKFDFEDLLFIICIILGGIAVVVLSLFIKALSTYIVFIIGLVGILAFYTIRSRSLEYEYILVEGDITIDKIIAMSKRKTILHTKVIDFQGFGKAEEFDKKKWEVKKIMSFASSPNAEGVYYFIIKRKNRMAAVFFEPDRKMLDEIDKRTKDIERSRANRLI